MKPLNLAEVKTFVANVDEKKNIHSYIKRFGKLSKADAEKLADKIRGLKSDKINEEKIAKIVDFVPQTPEEVGKVFNDISLNEQETNSIVDIAKEF